MCWWGCDQTRAGVRFLLFLQVQELFIAEGTDRLKLVILYSGEDDPRLRRAAAGTVAMLSSLHPKICQKIPQAVRDPGFPLLFWKNKRLCIVINCLTRVFQSGLPVFFSGRSDQKAPCGSMSCVLCLSLVSIDTRFSQNRSRSGEKKNEKDWIPFSFFWT